MEVIKFQLFPNKLENKFRNISRKKENKLLKKNLKSFKLFLVLILRKIWKKILCLFKEEEIFIIL